MFEYKYEKIKVKGIYRYEPEVNYHVIIDSYANMGWRLVQIFAPPVIGNGGADYFELIFEKETKE